jgi:putative oxidoreductase
MTTLNEVKRPSRGLDAGLLLLRIAVPGTLLLKHGLEKVFTFSSMAQHFPDPVHIGPVPSLVISLLGDMICSLLIIVGLGTRWAALFNFLNIFVAWALVHHFQFFGHAAEHGELIVLYLGVMIALTFTGAGRFSLDHVIARSDEYR